MPATERPETARRAVRNLLAASPLPRRVLLLRAGTTPAHADGRLVGTDDPPLSLAGRAEVAERRRQWEWADSVTTSPFLRARQSVAIFTAGAPAAMVASFGPLNFGRWQGVPRERVAEMDPIAFDDWEAASARAQPPGGEALENFQIRVAEGIEQVFATGSLAPLVVTHGEVIREIVAQLSGEVLSRAQPAPSELVLLTRGEDGRFQLGRASSDPDPLRSALERTGASGVGPWRPERSVGQFELRGR
jgi:broad specificity phosphatase PhoE